MKNFANRLCLCIGLLIASMLIQGCSSTTVLSVVDDPRDQLIMTLAGHWHNRLQYDAVPATLKVAPSVSGEWLDVQHATFTKIDAPLIGTHVLYLEWRNNNAAGAISRQRIWSFRLDDAGQVRMDFYAFIDGAPWAGKGAESGAFRELNVMQLRGYGAQCGLKFSLAANVFDGNITADECSLTAASGRRMGIDARVAMLADGTLTYQESGKLADGRYAFRVPPTMPYRFIRIR
jgi:hypothetical protein